MPHTQSSASRAYRPDAIERRLNGPSMLGHAGIPDSPPAEPEPPHPPPV